MTRPRIHISAGSPERSTIVQAARRHDGMYWLTVDVHIDGLVIRSVLASPCGVAWPLCYGEPMIEFTDPDLQNRAEAHLRCLARQEQERQRLPSSRRRVLQ